MSRRANREGQRLTLSWLDDLGVRDRDLQERRDLLLDWATRHGYPAMRIVLPSGGVHLIVQGIADWRTTCEQSSLDVIEAALAQPKPATVSEEVVRDALIQFGRWRNWERFSFKPQPLLSGGSQFTLIIGDGTEEAWMRFARHGLYAQMVEACELLEQEWNESLLAWGESRGFPEFLYCLADGGEGKILAGAESWRVYLDKTDDQERIQMAMEATDQDELEGGREE